MGDLRNVPPRPPKKPRGKSDSTTLHLPHYGRVLAFAKVGGTMSKYHMNGAPKHCAFCQEPFTTHAWRGSDGKYYCGEFCEEGGSSKEEKKAS